MTLMRGMHAWSETAAGTNGGATALHTDSNASNVHIISGIQVSGDAAAVVTVESPAGTVLWQKRYAAAFVDNVVFSERTVRGTASAPILTKI